MAMTITKVECENGHKSQGQAFGWTCPECGTDQGKIIARDRVSDHLPPEPGDYMGYERDGSPDWYE